MKSIDIQGSPRENVGAKGAKQVRNAGSVPCILYGGAENNCFSVDERELSKLVFTPNVYIVKLNIDGKKTNCVMRDIQFHPVSDKVIHVDFMELFDERKVDVKIPVVLKGSAVGVRNGGRLRFATKWVHIRAFPSALPDTVDVDIKRLKIGQSIKVGELPAVGLEYLDSPNRVVAAVRMARLAIVEEEEEEELEEGAEGAEGAEGVSAESSEGETKKEGSEKKEKAPTES